MFTPFLFELRTVIDWISTETSLVFSEWVRVESIYAQVYQIKCMRQIMKHDSPRGQGRSHWKKFLFGGGLSFFLISILWFPLILFALSPTIGQPNIPREVSVNFQIGVYEPLFKAEVSKSKIHQFNTLEWKQLLNLYAKSQAASLFLEDYEAEDVVAVILNTNSSVTWNISPPNAQKMIDDIKSGKLTSCQFTVKISRPVYGKKAPEIIHSLTEITLRDPILRNNLIDMLEQSETAQPVLLRNIFPKILNARNNGKIISVSQLHLSLESTEKATRNLTLKSFKNNGSRWWELRESCEEQIDHELFQKFPHQDCKETITIFVFNEKVFPSQLGQLAVKG